MKIGVAMSGGVDSSVAAHLLRSQGHTLIGVFMRNWDSVNEVGECSADEDYRRVQEVCRSLDIPCRRVDFVKEYWNDVFSKYVQGLGDGLNLNPDILCNQQIKFHALLNYLTSTLRVDRIATGHYARTAQAEDGGVKLLQAVDRQKDQTYFLSLVSQSALRRTLFPVGHMTKDAVKQVAVQCGWREVADQKESYGLCFVGKRKFSDFISNYIHEEVGSFVSIDGVVLGHHKGHHFYTVGQRARLAGYNEPHYVISKCPESNTVTVVKGSSHPALFTSSFVVTPPHWIRQSHDFPLCCMMRTNHRKPIVEAELTPNDNGLVNVKTSHPVRAITPGQYAVFYIGEECLGASSIL